MKFKKGDRVKVIKVVEWFGPKLGEEFTITEIVRVDKDITLYKRSSSLGDGSYEEELELVNPTLLALPEDTTRSPVVPSIPQELIRFQEYQDSLELKIMSLKELISEKQHELEVLEEELVVVNKLEDIMKGEK